MGTLRVRPINLRLLIILAIIAILATAAYGSAVSNTFPDGNTRAGDGSKAISGYQVTNIHYTLNSDPTKIDSIQFDLNDAASTVKIQLNGGATWIDCTAGTAANSWTCDSPGETVLAANNLRVVAAQ